MMAYIGTEGYQINVELRNGSQHCQKNTPAFLKQTLDYARQITDAPLLVRLDSGNDSQDNYTICSEFQDVYFIVKRNLRKESPAAWLNLAENTDGTICADFVNFIKNPDIFWTLFISGHNLLQFLTTSHWVMLHPVQSIFDIIAPEPNSGFFAA